MKELLLYSAIYSWTASDFIKALEDAKDKPVTLRINSRGGDVQQAFGMIAKWAEHKQAKNIKVDAFADSMAAFFLCFASNGGSKTCLDVTSFTFHRASYGEWIESNSMYMTDAMWEDLNRINGFLRQSMEASINVKKFEKITGVTLDQLFSNTSRIDVQLNAEQAKEIGLIDEIIAITPEMSAEVNGLTMRIAAETAGIKQPKPVPQAPAATTTTEIPKKDKKMTIAEFKASHPEAYAEIFNEGVKAENGRITALNVWAKVDPEFVATAIKDGTVLDPAKISELSLKAVSTLKLNGMETEATAEVITPATPEAKTTEQKAADAIEANVVKGATDIWK